MRSGLASIGGVSEVPEPPDVTDILRSLADEGSPAAREHLWTLVYDELRLAANRLVRRERDSATLQPTALVHDVYLRLFGQDASPTWENRRHFFGAALRAMRQLLIDRGRRQLKRQEDLGWQVTLRPTSDGAKGDRVTDPIVLAETLDRLEAHDERAAQVVMLRFFGGLSHRDIATVLEISLPTVKRDWSYGRSWLYARLAEDS